MARVSVRHRRHEREVGLRGAGGQPGGGTDALDVPHHGGDLGVVAVAREFRHQREPRARGRGHGARAGPAGAQHHADRRDLVLGLDHRVGGLAALRVAPVLLQEADQRLDQARGRRDRVPRHDRDPAEHRAHRRRGVAVDQDLARGLGHALELERIALREIGPRPLPAGAHRLMVERQRLGLAAELRVERALDLVLGDAQELGEHADVDHVHDEPPQLHVLRDRGDQPLHRHAVDIPVVGDRRHLDRLVEHDHAPRPHRGHVGGCGLRVHDDQDVVVLAARQVALLADADREPGRQPRDVRREQVLAAHRDAHLEDGAQQDAVGRLAAGAVDGRHLEAEVVDDALLALLGLLLLNREVCR